MKYLGVILLSGIGVFWFGDVTSQSLTETALLFSRTMPAGSARVQGMGGAQVGLGGDFSSATSNPAGLGMFNRSEGAFSASYALTNNLSEYFGDTTNQVKTSLTIPALSFAFHSKKERGIWVGSTFAINYSRLNDFNSTVRYEGYNNDNSIADYLAVDSDGTDPDDLLQGGQYYNTLNGLAYNNYLIEPDPSLIYYSAVGINPNDLSDVPSMFQEEEIRTKGGQNQLTASYGINLADRFFFGISGHLRTISFESRKTYQESDFYFEAAPSYDPLNNLVLEESLKIKGSGFSASVGAMVRPMDGLQVGVAYNMPTTYTLTDVYSASMSTDWNDFDYYGDGSVILNEEFFETAKLNSEYTLKTPGRISAGVTYFFGKFGFATTEVDVINYSTASYTSKLDFIDYDFENDEIETLYKNTVNFRLGGEYRLKDFRFRAGVGRQGEPFDEKQDDVSRALMNYSLGAGYRKQKFYVDAALMIRASKSSYHPYTVGGDFTPNPLVSINTQGISVMFTVGFPF
jgi:long-subunit fatty acid transport protein